MQAGELLYRGKSKSIYRTDDPDLLLMEFRDDATAFNAAKHAELNNKGRVNNQFNAYIMELLSEKGIATHFESIQSATSSTVRPLEIIPLECIARNYAAGSFCRRLAVEEGTQLKPSTFELSYKSDELGDPLVNQSYAMSLGWATRDELATMQSLTEKVNAILTPLFAKADLRLVDFKLEFGRYKGNILLGDEITPDGCRIWDVNTKEKLDKDRFRQDLGNVIESYQIVAKRMGIPIK